MKYLAGFSAIIFAVCAHAQTADVCPTLPADSGFEWKYREGPDFDLCYGVKPGSSVVLFGLYLGGAPNFHPEQAARIASGEVGGHKVTWYSQEGSPLGRQALIELDKESGSFAHVWVIASTDQELQARLSVIQRIMFKPASAP